MFVVRIENDEATLYRAFRRMSSAKAWAAQEDAENSDSLVDIFDAPLAFDCAAAVKATRDGRARLIARGETLSAHAGLVSYGIASGLGTSLDY